MTSRLLALAALAATTACSQRAPWRVIPAPAAPTPPASMVGGPSEGARQQSSASTSLPALSTVSAVPSDATSVAHMRALYFPVAVGDSVRLDDSFEAPRDGGARKHQAIDIIAPKGTPVLSAGDGRVLRMSNSPKGGITLYATDLEERFVYYYAHLDRYHPSVYAGKPLLRGDTLGYVGTTGNAPKDTPHLHFQVMRMPPDRKFWNGEPVNPYPLLRQPASAEQR